MRTVRTGKAAVAEQAVGAAFTVRITGADGTVGGLGALVAGRHVVTCAHVVNAALGLNPFSQPRPDRRVHVEFPLLDGDGTAAEADVVKWWPPPGVGVAGDDIAGLELTAGSVLPAVAVPARLAVEPPRLGHRVYVFGYPATPPRPDGGRVATTVQGLVSNGRLQLDSTPDSALRVQPGFSGSPVLDDATGRVVGLLALAAEAEARDSYAISADRLRLAWPEILAGRWQPTASTTRRREAGQLTILHLCDLRFDRDRLPGASAGERAEHPLFGRLHADLAGLAATAGLRPDLLVVTGNLTGQARPAEFRAAAEFIGALAEEAEIPRRHVAVIPGDRDVSRLLSMAYFAEQEAADEAPVPPYSRKWRYYTEAFRDFYAGLDTVAFTPDEPWTLFEMPDLAVVVAGLNSTMAESHRDCDDYGETGARQLGWFAARLAARKDEGWLRLAAVHHNVADGSLPASARLRDAADLDRVLGRPRLVNLLLQGQADGTATVYRLASGLVAVSAGGAAVDPDGAAAQYQLVTVRRDGFTRAVRQYATGQQRWVGDTRVSATGSDWRDRVDCPLSDVDLALPPPEKAPSGGDRGAGQGKHGTDAGDRLSLASRRGDFFERVADATRAKVPGAVITERPEEGYLRVTVSRDGGRIDQWPVGVIDGPVTEGAISHFVERVHRQFAADVPGVPSELVYRPPAASAGLADFALRQGVLLRSLAEYQGLLDLSQLAEAQRERLASDWIYPARLYVDQRYRIISGGGHADEVRAGLVDQAVQWAGAEGARLVVVLGDFGRGKTSFLRQLTRVLPGRLPGVTPILVELRSLEKAPSLDELLAQHLARHGVEDISLGKLRYMISSGRIALLLDGFDELELRVGYENAADYLQTLIGAVTGQAKVILTSRTQHFRSTGQVQDALSGRAGPGGRTALGERVESRPESRVVVLEEFSDDQIVQFLSNLYDGDTAQARARFELISGIGNLLDLAHNPRLLSFVADLDEDRLRAAQDENGQISAASLYETIIDRWLDTEAQRHLHRAGLPAFSKEERLAACTALALRLWASQNPAIALGQLTAEVAATLAGLTERGFTEEQAAHSVASGSLLVRTEDGAFAFIHQSVMEWLVAKAAAGELDDDRERDILASRRMSLLMAAFFADLAGPSRAREWADGTLAGLDAPEAARQNAIAVMERIAARLVPDMTTVEENLGAVDLSGQGVYLSGQDLAGLDLRGQDLTGASLRGANLREANLSGMRLDRADLTGADLTGADLTGVVMTGGSLRAAILSDSTWIRAAVLGTEGVDDPDIATEELAAAAVSGKDPVQVMVAPSSATANCAAFSPDGALLAYGDGTTVRIADAGTGKVLRILPGHADTVTAVAFSPDGTLLATASRDGTARTWDTATGIPRTTLTGHDNWVNAVAFSPDGTLLATASDDGTARTWDTATGIPRTTLTGHDNWVSAVAFSPDGSLLATSSSDRTARTWDTATGAPRTTLTGHDDRVTAVAFSPDGTLLATASADRSARTWDTATGAPRTTLTGHDNGVTAVAFSPDGTLLATASADRTARTWDTATGTNYDTLTGHNERVTAVAFSPDGSLLATGSDDDTARLWKLGTRRSSFSSGPESAVLRGHTGPVRNVAFSRDGRLLATGSDDRTARVWDVRANATRTVFAGHDAAVNSAAFSPDGTLLATASADGTTCVWDAGSGTRLATLVVLAGGGYATLLPGGRYKLEGEPGDRLWWAIKLCRFGAGELDPYVPGVRRVEAAERVIPLLGV